MADRIRMIARSTFANDRMTVLRDDGTEADRGTAVVPEGRFTTDLWHAKELVRAGLAEAESPADLEGDHALSAHHQVSTGDLAADQARLASLALAIPPADGLEAMTVADLRTLAERETIDLGDATKKADLVAAIRSHRAAPTAA